MARAKAIATRVAGNKEGDSKGSKGNGNGSKVAGNKEGNCKHHLQNQYVHYYDYSYQCGQRKKTYILRWCAMTHDVAFA